MTNEQAEQLISVLRNIYICLMIMNLGIFGMLGIVIGQIRNR